MICARIYIYMYIVTTKQFKSIIQKLMRLGYIHNNREEQTRVLQVLKMTSESVALDELGIGRIRDAFADKMFPGISTLQKHLKYFSLMPQLYRKATEKRYNRQNEVKSEVVRLERIMTKNLYEGSKDKRGITGSDLIGKNWTNYVKYDPAYIYIRYRPLKFLEVHNFTNLYIPLQKYCIMRQK